MGRTGPVYAFGGGRVLLVGLIVAAMTMSATVDHASASSGFSDVGANAHADSITALAELGVTLGCDREGTRYCPSGDVTRAQMATFVVRSLRERGVPIPPGAPDAFRDDDGSPHEASINALAAMGVVQGGQDGRYRPNDPVTRAQMGSFLQRGFGLPPIEENRFRDVSGPHANAINAIAAFGITLGCDSSGQVYCPQDDVRRDQMASFLMRAIRLPSAPSQGPGGAPPDDSELPPAPSVNGASASDEEGGVSSADLSAAGSGRLVALCRGHGGWGGWGNNVLIDDSDLIPAWGWSSQWIATRHYRFSVPSGGTINQGRFVLERDWHVFAVNNNPYDRVSVGGGGFRVPVGHHAAYIHVMAWDGYRWHTTIANYVQYVTLDYDRHANAWWCTRPF